MIRLLPLSALAIFALAAFPASSLAVPQVGTISSFATIKIGGGQATVTVPHTSTGRQVLSQMRAGLTQLRCTRAAMQTTTDGQPLLNLSSVISPLRRITFVSNITSASVWTSRAVLMPGRYSRCKITISFRDAQGTSKIGYAYNNLKPMLPVGVMTAYQLKQAHFPFESFQRSASYFAKPTWTSTDWVQWWNAIYLNGVTVAHDPICSGKQLTMAVVLESPRSPLQPCQAGFYAVPSTGALYVSYRGADPARPQVLLGGLGYARTLDL